MNRKLAWTLVISLVAVADGWTQIITGSGTTNTIPQFTSSTTLGDSPILQSNGSIGIGTNFLVGKLSVLENRDAIQNGFQPYAVYGNISSSLNFAAGVRGDATSTTGGASGVIGVAYSPVGSGVIGLRTGSDGAGGAGITGSTDSTGGFSFGARGTAFGATGFSIGVFGEAFSPDGYAAMFSSHGGGNIIVGTEGPYSSERRVFRVDRTGRVFADGGFRPFGADFAESVVVKGSADHYAPGDLLVIDPSGERRLSLSQTPYSTLIAGIYSTQPGVVASTHRVDEALPKNEVPLAVVGIVPCKVVTENGPIAAGDLLVTSSMPGYAMKGIDRPRMLGAVVGKALEPLPKGMGVIQVLVTLQ
jgi:hypothetical protein